MEIKNIANFTLNFIIKSIVKIIGLIITFKGLFLIISLLSFSPDDPNFIFPDNTEIKNLLGIKGSIVADIFFQSLGIISLLVSISLIITGFNIIKSKKIILVVENYFFIVLYSLIGSLFFTIYYSNSFWLPINGNGGFVGKFLENTFLFSIIDINQKISYFFLLIIIFLLFK